MTAQIPDRSATPPSDHQVHSQIVSTVRALAAARGVKHDQVADAIGLSRSTMYARLGGSRFNDGELARLAWYFDVSVSDLYDGFGGRLAGSQSSLRSDKSRYRSFVPVVAGSVTKITVDYPDNIHDLLPRIERRRVERRVSDRRMTA